MSLSPFSTPQPPPVTSRVAIEPIHNTLMAMALLSSPSLVAEREPWLAQASAQLTPEQRRRNSLVFDGLGECLLFATNYATFPAYLDALAAHPAAALCERISTHANSHLDAAQQQDVEQFRQDPPAMQHLIVTHLRDLWETLLAPAWTKKASMLAYVVRELDERAWPTTSTTAAVRAVLRRPVPDWLADQVCGVEHIIFAPSPYIHFHTTHFDDPTTLWVFMWADFREWPMRSEPIQRSEVLGPLNALADETRLRILELLAASTELRAQEIIAQLDVSQPTVSRHLKQLLNAGFVSEQRAGDANKLYRLQRERMDEVAYSLSQLLSEENARLVLSDVRLEQPAALRPFLDRNGWVTSWPAKRKGQEAVLDYLITKFDAEQEYTEEEVNELLKAWHTYDDPAYLRRSLVDAGLLARTADGAQYWRVEAV